MPFGISPTALLAILQPWADVAEPIHRRIARLVDATPDQEVVWIGCGVSRSVLWWVQRHRSHTVGVDADHDGVERGERAAQAAGLAMLATFQTAPASDLPHEAQVFDVTVVSLLCLPDTNGEKVIQEAGRVARPMSAVIALAPSWLSAPPAEDVTRLAELGLYPKLQVEWKAAFRQAGLVELVVEEAAQDGRWMSPGWVGLLIRGWRAARWMGIRTVLSREFRTLRRLALRRTLGLSIVKGTRWPHE